ncbi:hypothetical protein BC829DRAFT_218037 [Chytridium lagenaria]|nr:hypothetical protein BC829DRAFT_218037 [Chytridium lagenaria]
MTLKHFSLLHTLTMLHVLITVCIVRRANLVENILLFSNLGSTGTLECVVNCKEMRRLFALERVLERRKERGNLKTEKDCGDAINVV